MINILNRKSISSWKLFWLITVPISITVIVAMTSTDLSGAEGVSSLIQLSVRCAVPLLYVTFAASAIQALFPGVFSRWLFLNRKYIGLSFAVAMAWQAFFILWLVTVYREYYIEEVYVLRDAIEGVVSYFFLTAMVITSFQAVRQRMNQKAWRLLHLIGIYLIWAYAFSTYWWSLFYYSDPVPLDSVYYWGGFIAWFLRVAAWNKKRLKMVAKEARASSLQASLSFLGISIIVLGFVAASFGSAWYSTAGKLLYGYAITRIPETYFPYWPFEPWFALAIIALGMFLVAKARA